MLKLREWEQDADKAMLRESVISCGYPRDISDQEMVVSCWYTYGPGVFWMHVEDGYEEELAVHCCLTESERGKPFARDWLAALKLLGQLMGYEWLRVWLDFPDVQENVIANYLVRLGFTSDHRGLRCRTWGSSDGKSTESPESTIPSSG
jgi:hypothetical protein